MVQAFETGISKFGRIDIVVANAGIMESTAVLDMQVDEDGVPLESTEAVKVIDVNLKGTLNSKNMPIFIKKVRVTITLSTDPFTRSTETGTALLEQEHPFFSRRLSRCRHPRHFDVRLLWHHGECRLHRLKARCSRSPQGVTAKGGVPPDQGQLHRPVLHAHVHHCWTRR